MVSAGFGPCWQPAISAHVAIISNEVIVIERIQLFGYFAQSTTEDDFQVSAPGKNAYVPLVLPEHYGAMRLARVSVWKALYARKANQPPSFLLDSVTLFISLVAKSCHELYRTTVRKVHGAPSRCCISTVPAEVSLGRFGGADSIFSKSSRCPGVGRKTETT